MHGKICISFCILASSPSPGPADLFNGELKLIMGLIWTLIRRYQIRSTGKDLSTKAAMLAWINTQIPDQNINNFTSDWNSGVALCALVDRIEPGVCPQYGTLNRSDKLGNCALGLRLAEEKLNIPKILEAEDLSHPDIDEISIMTYISYFCKPANDYLLAWVQKQIPDRKITNFQTDWNNGINLSCLIEKLCPGSIPNCRQLDPHKSLENLVAAMRLGEDHLGVKPVIKPSQMADPKVDELNVVTYLSRFQYAKPIPQPHEVTCSGNGLYKAFVGRYASFDVDGTKGGIGDLKILIKAKGGSPITADIKPHPKTNGMFEVKYIPHVPGKLTIEVSWSGYVIPASPFTVDVLDPGALTFTGKYITGGHCARVGKQVVMDVGGLIDPADLYVLIQHADGHTETAKIVDKGNGKAECMYVPVRVGKDEIFAKIAGTDLPGSPFEVKVVDPNQCHVSQHDPPLGKPILVNTKATFSVIAHGVNAYGIVAIAKTPSGMHEISIMQSDDDSPNSGSFTPTQTGEHEISVTCDGENIRGSPFKVSVGDPSKCTFLDTLPRYLQVKKPLKVHLSTKGAGPGTAEVTSSQAGILRVQSKKGAETDLVGIELSPSSSVGESTVTVKWNGVVIGPTPHTMFVCDASRCSAYGPGLTSGKGKIEELFTFTVQAKEAGRGELTVKPRGQKSVYSADIHKNTDGTYNVSFKSYEIGPHEIDILWGGEPIPNSPYKVEMARPLDISKVSVQGPGLERAVANRRAQVMVYARESKLIDRGALSIVFKSASGAENENPDVDIYDNENGSYSVAFTPQVAGILKLSVAGDGDQVNGSPFNITVDPEPKPDMCTIRSRSGKDIFKDGSDFYHIINKPLELAVDTTNAGTGSLTVTGEKPDESSQRVFATDEQQGKKKLTLLKFEPTVLGTHKLNVLWDGIHIPKSPFKIHVVSPQGCRPKEDFPKFIKIGDSKSLSFIAESSGTGDLTAKSSDVQVTTKVQAKNLIMKGASLGAAKVHVLYGGYDILGSPYTVGVCDPSKVTLDVVQGQKYIVGTPFSFKVNVRNAGNGELEVKPVEPTNRFHIELNEQQTGKWKVICTPQNHGNQALAVKWGGYEVDGSPLYFHVSDPRKVTVKGLPDPKTYVPIIGEPINFTIDYTAAGDGDLKAVAKLEDREERNIEREETDGNSKIAAMQLIPSKPGKLELVLKFNGQNILPAVCIYEVPDPTQFQVTPPKGFGKMKEYVKFPIIGVAKDTDLKITALHSNHDATVKTEPGKDSKTVIARFTPKHTGEYNIDVKHKGQNIAGSPFTVQIVNPDVCKPVGSLPSVVHIGDTFRFEIDTSEAGPGSISFDTVPLSGDVKPEITSFDNKHAIRLEEGIGKCKLSIKYADYDIPSTPVDVSFVDSGKVTWSSNRDLTTVKQGEIVIITLDCTKAGEATPMVKSAGPQSEHPSQLTDNKDGTFSILLNPWQVGENTVNIRYGGHPIPNSPIKFELVKAVEANTITATGEALSRVIAGVPSSMTINTPDPSLLDRGLLKAKFLSEENITKPSIELVDVGDGRYDLTMLSENEGEFSLDISCEERSIVGSPFKIRVSAAPCSDKCVAYGPALVKNPKLVVNDPLKFTVDTTDAGTGSLKISAKQPNDKTIQVYQNNESGDKILSHLKIDPEIVGPHVVTVTWDGADIPGSPFTFNIVDPSKVQVKGLPPQPHGLAYINEPVKFSASLSTSGATALRVYCDPPGESSPTFLTSTPTSDGNLAYEFTPKAFGNHLVSVEAGGVDIQGSPYKVNVVDPSKFSIAGLSLKGDYAIVCEMVSIYIHGNASDDEPILVTAHGPTADLTVETTETGDGKYQANFVPIEPGCYEVFVEYGGVHVNGSPFTVNVADPSKCQVLGDVPEFVQVGKSEDFTVKTRGAGIGTMEALVNGQTKSSLVDVNIVNEGLDTYSVVLTGKKVSDVSLDAQWAGFSIPQSPFSLSVCDASLCTALGVALEHKRGMAGEAIVFTVKSENAGKGKLSVIAKGPSAQYNVEVKEIDADLHEVTFTPWEIGEHTIEVLWGNADIKNSPFLVNVTNPNDSTVCNATGDGLKRAIAGNKSNFLIISSESGLLDKNALKVTVMGVQSHAEVVINDNNNGTYGVEYTPPTSGAYVASISFYDRQIPGSPFKINVFPKPDASKCFAYGPALNQNSILIAGSPLELYVDTKEGGHGQLRVYIQGPNDYRPKVFIADDNQGVYSIKFDAMKAGKYFVVVAWSEEHIPGSPFKLRVHPAADASKVKAYGPGLIDGFLGAPGEYCYSSTHTHIIIL